jgi:exopolysaccharide biosynthesis polyprenyl glycosylphosphotransferase
MYRLKQLTILFGDLLALYIGLYLAILLRYFKIPNQFDINNLIGPFSWLFLAAIIITFISGAYDLGKAKNNSNLFKKIFFDAVIWTVVGVLYFYIIPKSTVNPKTILVLTSLCGFGLLSIWRFIYNKFVAANILTTKVVFIGLSDEAKKIAETIIRSPQIGYEVIGIVDSQNCLTNIPCVKNLSDLKINPDLIVLDFDYQKNETIAKDLYQKIFQQISIIDLADFYEIIYRRLPPFTFSESWFLTKFQEQSKKIYDRFRLLTDFIAASLIGIFFIATFPFIALIIKLNSKGPILFKQIRIGRGGQKFYIYKYRTMKVLNVDGSAETNGPQFASEKDSRITFIGKLLRATRLDEVPQFINIFKNEMGLIGPRPERPEFVDQLTKLMPFYTLRHLVKPGLTGWAQLQRGYYGTIDENLGKLEYDLYYIKNRGPWLDIAIVLKTISVVLTMMGR